MYSTHSSLGKIIIIMFWEKRLVQTASQQSVDHAPRRGMVLPFEPLSFAFNHVNYYVDMPVKLEDALIAAKKFSSLHQMHLTKLAHLAKACTQENPQLRPSMRSIVIALMTLSSSTDEWDVGSSYKNQDLVNLMSGR
ncbi:hypothetical protein F0562_011658 [Nyssa sinensis]|uniref:Serine-threonine/tyrosine-protein kinase catalytic domain-containing protein n=1 Tax=Nyssa sinensis TaxID=561372 RepID=A0A5J4ZQL2_9ASTE|nr:hypothetical protein F0562_011658 [Nyssa sinensis]